MLIRNLKKAYENKIVIIILILLFLISRIILSTTSLKYTENEESKVGIMAKHIAEGKEMPFFCYGQQYSGACAIHAYLAAPLYMIFENSTFTIRFWPTILSTLVLIVTYFFLTRFFNKKIAILACLLIIFAPPAYIQFNLLHFPYMTTVFFNILLLLIFYKIFYAEREQKIYYVLFGVVCAISIYSLEMVIPIILLCLIFWFMKDKTFFLKKEFYYFLSSFILGSLPLIIYNINNNFAHVKQFFAGTFLHKMVCNFNLIPTQVDFGGRVVDHCKVFSTTRAGSSISNFLFNVIPNNFGFGDFIPHETVILEWAYFIVFLTAMIYLTAKNRKSIMLLSRGLIPVKKYSVRPNEISKDAFIIIFLLLFPFFDYWSGFADTRHLIPMYPMIMIILALFLFDIKNKTLFNSLLGVLLLITMIGNAHFINTDFDYDTTELIRFMEENNMTRAYTSYSLKWKLIYNSNEKIIASCEGLCKEPFEYPIYESILRAEKKYSIVTNSYENYDKFIESYLINKNIPYKKMSIGKKNVYYDFNADVRPADIEGERPLF